MGEGQGKSHRRRCAPANRRELKAVTARNLLICYGREIIPKKRGKGSESYMLKTMLLHRLSLTPFKKLSAASIIAYRDELSSHFTLLTYP